MRERSSFQHDLLASVVVFLVALPLCMGVAIASGMPPALGIVTGIVGGLIVGIIQGSPMQVSGPAAGLAVLVLQLVQSRGLAGTAVIVLFAGLLQMAAGLARGGRWFRAVPPSVIHGMLAGIGVLIFASQFHVMVDDKPKGDGLRNLMSVPEAIWKGITPDQGKPHEEAALIGLLTIGTIVLWQRFAPRRLKVVPAPLVAVTLATVVTAAFALPIARVPVPDSLLGVLSLPSLEELRKAANLDGLLAAVGLALIASAETLLCAGAVDRMHTGPRTDFNRELLAQGVGNTLCGLIGAPPMTGVIVRSSANVQAGALHAALRDLPRRLAAGLRGGAAVRAAADPGLEPGGGAGVHRLQAGQPGGDPAAAQVRPRRGVHLRHHGDHHRLHRPAQGRAARPDAGRRAPPLGGHPPQHLRRRRSAAQAGAAAPARLGHLPAPARPGRHAAVGAARPRAARALRGARLPRPRRHRAADGLGEAAPARGGRVVIEWDALESLFHARRASTSTA